MTAPKLSWSDLAGARVGVWGLGREGHASLRRLLALGVEPVLVDDQPAGQVDGRPVLAAGDGGLAALERCDAVVKTPGLSRYRPEVAHLSGLGIPVVGGLGLWLAEADLRRVLCVTGTKGKSTTSSVAGHLITGLGHRCMVGGNIGAVPYDPDNAGDFDYWVIEVSSYQATDLPCSPPVVAVTSLHPDHLDWHGGVERYYRDKLSACSRPGAELTVANGDSDLLREHAALLGPRVEWVGEDDEPGADWMAPLGLPGRHNRRNALIARRCLVALGVPGAAGDAGLRAAAAGYRPLPSRLTTVGVVGGVTFVDDSLSTNVLPTLAALDAFPGRRIALIAGGHDRGIDYAPLAAGLLARDAPTYVLTLPGSGPRIRAAIEAVAPATARGGGAFAGVTDCADLVEAVTEASRWARPDGIVLLSPAAPSFGQFRDYRDRGEAFARAVGGLCLVSGLATFPPLRRLKAERRRGRAMLARASLLTAAAAAVLLLGVAGCGSARPSGQQAPAHGAPSGSAASSRVRSGSNPAATPSSAAPAAAPGPVPAGFAATSVTFVSADEAFVLGTAPCAHAPCTAILRTRDRGATWAALPAPPVPVGEPGATIAPIVWGIRFATPEHGFVFGDSGVWETTDGGARWTRDFTPAGSFLSLAIAGQQVLAVNALCVPDGGCQDAALIRRPLNSGSPGGGTWTGVAQAGVGNLLDPDDMIATQAGVAAVLDGRDVLVTRDGGLTHTTNPVPCSGEPGAPSVAVTSATGLVLLCIGGGYTGHTVKQVYVSDDDGAHWTAAGVPSPAGDGGTIAATTTGDVAIATASAASWLFHSGDGGVTWQTVNTQFDGGMGWADLGFTTAADGVVVHGPADSDGNSTQRPGQLFLTSDGGASWTPVRF